MEINWTLWALVELPLGLGLIGYLVYKVRQYRMFKRVTEEINK